MVLRIETMRNVVCHTLSLRSLQGCLGQDHQARLWSDNKYRRPHQQDRLRRLGRDRVHRVQVPPFLITASNNNAIPALSTSTNAELILPKIVGVACWLSFSILRKPLTCGMSGKGGHHLDGPVERVCNPLRNSLDVSDIVH